MTSGFYRSAIPLVFSGMILSACGGGGSAVVVTPNQPTPPAPPQPPGDPNDFRTEEYNQNWALEAINAAHAYAEGYTGDGVVVGMVDFGFDFDFQDVVFDDRSRGRVQSNVDIYEAQIGDEAPDGRHGLSVASVIAASKNDSATHGVAYDATILAADFFSGVNTRQVRQDGILYHVSDPYGWLYQQGARIANKSLGYDEEDIISNPPTVSERYVLDFDTNFVIAGGLLVSSAGNNSDPEPSLSNLDAMDRLRDAGALDSGAGAFVIVGAVDENNEIASFSDRAGSGESRFHFMVAPGVDVRFSFDNGTDGFGVYQGSGTSFSAPMVSGAAAIIMQRWPSLTPREVRDVLFDSATDLGAAGVDAIYGHGLLNLDAALQPVGNSVLASPVPGSSFGPGSVTIVTGGAFGDAPELANWLGDSLILDSYGRDFRADLSAGLQGDFAPLFVAGLFENRRNWLSSSVALPDGSFFTSGARYNDELRREPWKFTQYEQGLDQVSDVTFEFGWQNGRQQMRLGRGKSLTAALEPETGAASPSTGWELVRDGQGEPGRHGSLYLTSAVDDRQSRLSWGFAYKEADKAFNRADPFQPWEGTTTQAGVRFDQWGRNASWFASVGAVREDGAILGATSSSTASLGTSATSLFMKSGASFSPAGRLHLSAEITGWATDPSGNYNGLLAGSSRLFSMGAKVRASLDDAFMKRDRLELTVSQPLRIEAGFVTGAVASVDRQTGAVTWDQTRLNLSPSGRELALEAAWSASFGWWSAETRLAWREDAGHIKGVRDRAAMLYLSGTF